MKIKRNVLCKFLFCLTLFSIQYLEEFRYLSLNSDYKYLVGYSEFHKFSFQRRCKHSINVDTQSRSLNTCICIEICNYLKTHDHDVNVGRNTLRYSDLEDHVFFFKSCCLGHFRCTYGNLSYYFGFDWSA